MKRCFALTLVALALVVAVPPTTSAVPAPDVVPTTEVRGEGLLPAVLDYRHRRPD